MSDSTLELRERYAQLRAEDRTRKPEIEAVLERARAQVLEEASRQSEAGPAEVVPIEAGRRGLLSRRAPRWTLAAGSLAAATLAAIMLTQPTADEDFEALVTGFATDVAGGIWRSPTAGLLEVPGIELIRSIPSIGGTVDLGGDLSGLTGQGNNG